jgi:hypothetical protein
MKKSILNLRLDESTKEALDAKCLENGVSVSTGAREAIKKYLLPVENNLDQNCHTTLICSLGFCEFIFWLLDKLRNPEVCEVECLFQQHMDLIIEFKNNIYFDEDILSEFMKVYYIRELMIILISNSLKVLRVLITISYTYSCIPYDTMKMTTKYSL